MPNHRYRSAKAWQKISPAAHLTGCEASRCMPPERASKKRFAKKAARGQTGRGKYPQASQSVYRGELKSDGGLCKITFFESQSVYRGELKFYSVLTLLAFYSFLAIRIQRRVEIMSKNPIYSLPRYLAIRIQGQVEIDEAWKHGYSSLMQKNLCTCVRSSCTSKKTPRQRIGYQS